MISPHLPVCPSNAEIRIRIASNVPPILVMMTLIPLLSLSLAHGYVARNFNRPRRIAAVPAMQASSHWPPPLDDEAVVHVFDIGFRNGKGENVQMALTQVSNEKRAVLAFWRFAYEQETGGEASKITRVQAELRAQMALAGAAGVTMGAYLHGLENEEHAIALVRFESETSGLETGASAKVMFIDTVLVTPTGVPVKLRAPLHKAMVTSLRTLGEANGMTVRLWTDYNA